MCHRYSTLRVHLTKNTSITDVTSHDDTNNTHLTTTTAIDLPAIDANFANHTSQQYITTSTRMVNDERLLGERVLDISTTLSASRFEGIFRKKAGLNWHIFCDDGCVTKTVIDWKSAFYSQTQLTHMHEEECKEIVQILHFCISEAAITALREVLKEGTRLRGFRAKSARIEKLRQEITMDANTEKMMAVFKLYYELCDVSGSSCRRLRE